MGWKISRVSVVDRLGRGRRERGLQPARQGCRAEGCGRPTTERKPFCIAHLDRLPYVRELQTQLLQREQEELAAEGKRAWRAVDPMGSRAREIIDQLAVKGAQTPKRLALTVDLRPNSLEGYLAALERAGLVKTLVLGSRRGTPRRVVTLTDEGKLATDATETDDAPDSDSEDPSAEAA